MTLEDELKEDICYRIESMLELINLEDRAESLSFILNELIKGSNGGVDCYRLHCENIGVLESVKTEYIKNWCAKYIKE